MIQRFAHATFNNTHFLLSPAPCQVLIEINKLDFLLLLLLLVQLKPFLFFCVNMILLPSRYCAAIVLFHYKLGRHLLVPFSYQCSIVGWWIINAYFPFSPLNGPLATRKQLESEHASQYIHIEHIMYQLKKINKEISANEQERKTEKLYQSLCFASVGGANGGLVFYPDECKCI